MLLILLLSALLILIVAHCKEFSKILPGGTEICTGRYPEKIDSLGNTEVEGIRCYHR